MFFELNGTTYKVRFHRNGSNTYAELDRMEPDVGIIPTNLMGVATLYYKDRFIKSTGRKVALADLIHRMQEVSAGDTKPEFTLTKEDKKYIWEQYFLVHKR